VGPINQENLANRFNGFEAVHWLNFERKKMYKQIILIMGALMLLAHITLNVNRATGDAQTISYDNEATLTATTIAQSTLREVSSKDFDEKSRGVMITHPDSLTSFVALGAEFGEAYPNFDDMDDFKGFSKTVPTGRLGNFVVTVDVSYTSKAAAGSPVMTQTFLKSTTVSVAGNSALKDTVRLRTITAY
jgi:hypothetical protein